MQEKEGAERSPRDEEDVNGDATRCSDCLEGERAGMSDIWGVILVWIMGDAGSSKLACLGVMQLGCVEGCWDGAF